MRFRIQHREPTFHISLPDPAGRNRFAVNHISYTIINLHNQVPLFNGQLNGDPRLSVFVRLTIFETVFYKGKNQKRFYLSVIKISKRGEADVDAVAEPELLQIDVMREVFDLFG